MVSRLRREDRGSAPVEFALVAPLVVLLALSVIQVVLAVHVRTVLVAAAAEGARVAATADGGPADGVRRTRTLLRGTLAADAVLDVTGGSTTTRGVRVDVVTIRARVPVLGLLGPAALTVTGRAVEEVP